MNNLINKLILLLLLGTFCTSPHALPKITLLIDVSKSIKTAQSQLENVLTDLFTEETHNNKSRVIPESVIFYAAEADEVKFNESDFTLDALLKEVRTHLDNKSNIGRGHSLGFDYFLSHTAPLNSPNGRLIIFFTDGEKHLAGLDFLALYSANLLLQNIKILPFHIKSTNPTFNCLDCLQTMAYVSFPVKRFAVGTTSVESEIDKNVKQLKANIEIASSTFTKAVERQTKSESPSVGANKNPNVTHPSQQDSSVFPKNFEQAQYYIWMSWAVIILFLITLFFIFKSNSPFPTITFGTSTSSSCGKPHNFRTALITSLDTIKNEIESIRSLTGDVKSGVSGTGELTEKINVSMTGANIVVNGISDTLINTIALIRSVSDELKGTKSLFEQHDRVLWGRISLDVKGKPTQHINLGEQNNGFCHRFTTATKEDVSIVFSLAQLDDDNSLVIKVSVNSGFYIELQDKKHHLVLGSKLGEQVSYIRILKTDSCKILADIKYSSIDHLPALYSDESWFDDDELKTHYGYASIVDDVLGHSSGDKLQSKWFCGQIGSGKTTLCNYLFHLMDKESKFGVKKINAAGLDTCDSNEDVINLIRKSMSLLVEEKKLKSDIQIVLLIDDFDDISSKFEGSLLFCKRFSKLLNWSEVAEVTVFTFSMCSLSIHKILNTGLHRVKGMENKTLLGFDGCLTSKRHYIDFLTEYSGLHGSVVSSDVKNKLNELEGSYPHMIDQILYFYAKKCKSEKNALELLSESIINTNSKLSICKAVTLGMVVDTVDGQNFVKGSKILANLFDDLSEGDSFTQQDLKNQLQHDKDLRDQSEPLSEQLIEILTDCGAIKSTSDDDAYLPIPEIRLYGQEPAC